MPKIRTKRSAAKRFKLTGTGKVRFYSAFLRHNTGKRPQNMKRTNRGGQILRSGDARLVKRYWLAGSGT